MVSQSTEKRTEVWLSESFMLGAGERKRVVFRSEHGRADWMLSHAPFVDGIAVEDARTHSSGEVLSLRVANLTGAPRKCIVEVRYRAHVAPASP